MNQIKIGRLIAEQRKKSNLTQMQLAEKLGITDRAISKWENGKGLPDASIMLDLCNILEISVNELLNGEVFEMKEYNKKAEQQLLELVEERNKKDRELLRLEIFVSVLITLILLSCIFVASFVEMVTWARIALIIVGVIPFIIGVCYAVRIEQVAGFYECKNCKHKYVPTYSQVFFAMHYGRARYMKCPKCGDKNYHKKVIG